MPVKIEYVPDKPILIATYIDSIDLEAVEELYQRSAEFYQQWNRPIYRIVDVRQANTTFAELIAIVKTSSQGKPGSTTDPNVHVIFVGYNSWIQLFRDALQLEQFGQKELPLFLEIEDALAYAEAQSAVDSV